MLSVKKKGTIGCVRQAIVLSHEWSPQGTVLEIGWSLRSQEEDEGVGGDGCDTPPNGSSLLLRNRGLMVRSMGALSERSQFLSCTSLSVLWEGCCANNFVGSSTHSECVI